MVQVVKVAEEVVQVVVLVKVEVVVVDALSTVNVVNEKLPL
jgi:hypothetical protein